MDEYKDLTGTGRVYDFVISDISGNILCQKEKGQKVEVFDLEKANARIVEIIGDKINEITHLLKIKQQINGLHTKR